MVKSILEIDVNDKAFKDFAARFEKYRDAVKKLPGAWKETEKVTDNLTENFVSMTAAVLAQTDAMKAANRQYGGAERATAQMARNTAKTAANIAGATLNLFKWIGIGSLLGGAGLFGIGSIANAVGSQRRSALGLGITTGQQSAYGVAYNRFVDTNSMLGNIADAKSDWSKRWVFGAMGMGNPDGQNPAQLGVDMMVRAKEMFDKSGQSEQEAKASGLLEIFSMEDLRRLHNTSMKELREREGEYNGSVGQLSRQDEINKKWQDFSDRVRNSGYVLQGLIVDKLGGKIIPALDKLSRASVDVLDKFLGNPKFDEWIDSIGTGIEKLASYIGTPEFASKMKTFSGDIVAVADGVHKALAFLGVVPSGAPLGTVPAGAMRIAGGQGDALRSLLSSGGPTGQGWSQNAAAAIAANLSAESNMNPFAKGDWNAKTKSYDAYGIAQWHPDRQAEYARVFGHTMQSVSDISAARREQLAFVNYELTRGNYKDVGSRIQNMDADDAGYLVSKRYERPIDPLDTRAMGRGMAARGIVVTINNAPGNSASATVAQVAQ